MCETIEMNVNVPACFELNELSTLQTIVHPSSSNIGFLVAGEHFQTHAMAKPIVRVYLMEIQDGKFEVTRELESFKFGTITEAEHFIEQLPNISALDLILLTSKTTVSCVTA